MKKLSIVTGIMLMLIMAGSIDMMAQRGMMRMRMDTTRLERPRASMDMPVRPGRNFYNRPVARGRFDIRPVPPMYGRGRGFSQGQGQGMWQNRPGRGYWAITSIPNLTDKQKEEIQDLRTKQQEEMQKLRDESSKKIQEMRNSHRKKILDLLTDEQKEFVESRQIW